MASSKWTVPSWISFIKESFINRFPWPLPVSIWVWIWLVCPRRIKLDTAAFTMSISTAATLPPPFFFKRVWEMTPFKFSDNEARIWFCFSAGKMFTTRSIVVIADAVWSVAKTRCPVLATSSANWMVSLSLSSPTRTISGSCRNAARSAGLNPTVLVCISLWLI